MDALTLVGIIARFLHVGSATLLVGALFVLVAVLWPAAGRLPETERESVLAPTLATIRTVTRVTLVVFFLTGLYNMLTLAQGMSVYKTQSGAYLAVLHLKVLLGFVVAGLVEVSASARRQRESVPPGFIAAALAVALVTVAMGAFLRRQWTGIPRATWSAYQEESANIREEDLLRNYRRR
jgi:uncharacterized membrane protein